MLVSCQGVVFHTIKYGDTSLITRIFTREMGVQSFLIKGARSQKGTIRPSHLIPMNLVDLVFIKQPNRSLHSIKELRCEPLLSDLMTHPNKRSIAMFMAEVLYKTIREEEKNTDLFDFISGSLQILDAQQSGYQLFPHYFLVQLTRYLGFFPDLNHSEGLFFDLIEGKFSAEKGIGSHRLNEMESRWFYRLASSSFNEIASLAHESSERRNLLDGILRYYQIHFDQFSQINSHEIFREVLSN
jgi:DNA repair protein RecO (recombination protein O)